MLKKFIYEITRPTVWGEGKEFNEELEKAFNSDDSDDIKQDLKIIGSRFWIDVTLASKELANALQTDPTETKTILENGIKDYQNYRKLRGRDSRFLDAQKTFEIIKNNLWKIQDIVKQTNTRINTLLIQYPGLHNHRSFQKIRENTTMPNIEIDMENPYIKAFHKIIIKGKNDTEILAQIKEQYRAMKGIKKTNRSEFYEDIWLEEILGNSDYDPTLLTGNRVKQADLPLIRWIINKMIEKSNDKNDNIISRLWELGVPQHILNTIRLRQIGHNKLVVKWQIDLPETWTKKRTNGTWIYGSWKSWNPGEIVYSTQHAEADKKEWRMQRETTDINTLVGQYMNPEEFLWAGAVIKDEPFDKAVIDSLIKQKKPIPALYFSSNGKGLYFFTIGREIRGRHSPYISAGIKEVNIPKGMKLNEDQIYKIVLTNIEPNRYANDEQKQSYIIHGKVLSEEND